MKIPLQLLWMFSVLTPPWSTMCNALLANGTTINTHVLWSSFDSPVRVTGMIDIESGGSLRIDEGVRVIFETEESGINNKAGQIYILGSISNKVILEPSTEEDENGWKGIIFGSSAIPATFTDDGEYQSGSIIRFTEIIRAGYRKSSHMQTYGLDFREGAVPYLFDINMIDCGGHYYGRFVLVKELVGFFVARHLRLSNNSTEERYNRANYGMEIQGLSIDNGLVILQNVDVSAKTSSYSVYGRNIHQMNVTLSNFKNQVYLQYVDYISFQDNTLSNKLTFYDVGRNGGPIIASGNTFLIPNSNIDALYAYLRYTRGIVSITKNTIIGASMNLRSSSYATVIVEDNVIRGSRRFALSAETSSTSESNMIVRNNLIQDCIPSSMVIVHLIANNQLQFENNTIIDNIANNNAIFFLESRSSSAASKFIFSGNSVENNIAKTNLVAIHKYPLASFTKNILVNNTAPLSVKLSGMSGFSEESPTISMPMNYWGNFQEDVMGHRLTVEDGFHNLDHRCVIDFNTVLNGTSINSGILPVPLPSFFKSDGSVGGLLINETIELHMATHVANSSIIIGSNASLILHNDVEIMFACNRGVYVMNGGTIRVNGNSTFIPKDSNTKWHGIILNTNNHTIIQHLRIKGANYCMKQDSNAVGSISLDHVLFQDCVEDGIRIDSQSSEVKVANSQVWNVGGYGIYSRYVKYLELVNSHVANCSNHAVYLWHANKTTLNGNTIVQALSSYDALYIYRPNEVLLESNNVQCWNKCLHIQFQGNKGARIYNNTMSGLGNQNSYRMAYIYGSSIYGSEIFYISHNSFENWNSPNYDAIAFTYSGGGNNLIMANNSFQEIRARRILTVDLATYDQSTNVANIFFGNLETTHSSHPALLYISNWYSNVPNAHSSLTGNVFDVTWNNETQQYAVIANVDSKSVPEINARSSYWGSDNGDFMPKLIYDGLDDYNLPFVSYIPFLLTPDINGPVSNFSKSVSFLKPGSMLSGILPEDETIHLTSDQSPYQSDGTLTIDGDMFVHENVTIKMKAGSKLVIQKGNLVAIGTPEAPVIFEKEENVPWRGIDIEPKFEISKDFQLLLAYTSSGNTFSVGKDDFNALFNNSTSKVLYRHCPYCTDTHRDIFYKRLTSSSHFDAYEAFTCSWTSQYNTLNKDFELYSTPEDLISGSNKWSYCSYGGSNAVGFPHRCGVTRSQYYQSSQYPGSCTESVSQWWHTSYAKEIWWLLWAAPINSTDADRQSFSSTEPPTGYDSFDEPPTETSEDSTDADRQSLSSTEPLTGYPTETSGDPTDADRQSFSFTRSPAGYDSLDEPPTETSEDSTDADRQSFSSTEPPTGYPTETSGDSTDADRQSFSFTESPIGYDSFDESPTETSGDVATEPHPNFNLYFNRRLSSYEYHLEWLPGNIEQKGLPYFLTSNKSLHLENIVITGVGNDAFSLSTKREGTYKKIKILESVRGFSISGFGSYNISDLLIVDSSSNEQSSIYISDFAEVYFNGLNISTSTNAAVDARSNSRLTVVDADIRSNHVYSRAFYLSNAFAHIEQLSFIAFSSLRNDAIYAYSSSLKSISIFNSSIDCRKCMHNRLTYLYTSSSSEVNVANNTFLGSSTHYMHNLMHISSAGDVRITGNSFQGDTASYTSGVVVYVNSRSIELDNNAFDNIVSRDSIWDLNANIINMNDNQCELCASGITTFSHGFLKLRTTESSIHNNFITNASGYVFLEIAGLSSSSFNFTDNALIHSEFDYFSKTTLSYSQVPGERIEIGPNYWGASYSELNKHTLDSRRDAGLATIHYSSIFLDVEMAIEMDSPPTGAIVDSKLGLIGGLIDSGYTIAVPAGLYYAEESIILRHPDAELILEAGVHIIFPSYSSIRIDKGTFKILGSAQERVFLTPTADFISKHGGSNLKHSASWGGIYFGSGAKKSIIGSSNEYISGSLLRQCSISNAGYASPTKQASVYLYYISVMLDGVSIEAIDIANSNSVDGVYFHRPPSVVTTNDLNIYKAGRYGLRVEYPGDRAVFKGLNVSMSGNYGLHLYYPQDTIISHSKFEGNNQRQIYLYSSYNNFDFNITSCDIKNSNNYGLYIYSGSSSTMRFHLSGSRFIDSKRPVYLIGSGKSDSFARIALNIFENNMCSDADCKIIELRTRRDILIQANMITGNIASKILHVGVDSNYVPDLRMEGNTFGSNFAPPSTGGKNSVLYLEGGESTWSMHGNNFNNSLSQYEISTSGFSGSDLSATVVNASSNFFTFIASNELTSSVIDGRIYDDDEDPSKPKVIFEPYLSSNSTLSCPSDCHDQGACVFPGFCVCEDSWTGPDCKVPTCQSLNFCSGNGFCKEYEECSCSDGWLGASCSVAKCTAVDHCSGNGYCAVPNECTCDIGHTGPTCNDCVTNYRLIGSKCLKCPLCYNGGSCSIYNDSTRCECIENFTGEQCRSCLPGFFGPTCKNYPFVDSIAPNDAIDLGGAKIRLEGLNLGNLNNSVRCDFSAAGIVDAIVIVENSTIECIAPSAVVSTSGLLLSSVRAIVDGLVSWNQIPFTFYGECPEDACISTNGFCSFGRCQCYYSFTGDSCEERFVAPKLSQPGHVFEMKEGQPFSYQFAIEEGTTPIEFLFSSDASRPSEMTLDSATGKLSWPAPIAANRNVVIGMLVQNVFASKRVELQFRVLPSYVVKVSTSTVSVRRPSPSIPFMIETMDAETLELVGNKEAVLWIRRENTQGRRKFSVSTGADGTASFPYRPYRSESGRFLCGGEHPHHENTTMQDFFLIRSIGVSPSSYYYSGTTNDNITLHDVFRFSLQGGSFSGLRIGIESSHAFLITPTLDSSVANETMGIVKASVSIYLEDAVQEIAVFSLRSDEGDLVRFSLFLDIKERTPKLRITPSTMHVEIARDGDDAVQYRDVTLENTGSRKSDAVDILLPDQPILRSVSGDSMHGLEVNEKRTVTFGFVASPDMEIGRYFYGKIALRTNGSTALLNYRATIVSTVPASLTVVTENEATYFVEGNPNLANVTVRVRSLTRGNSYTLSSGPEGNVTFSDLVQDFYEVICQKLKHKQHRTTLHLQSPGQTILAFLAAEVVSYTFSVIPVEIVESYVIEIKSTFETFVPKPVLIWEPAFLDFDAMRYGRMNELRITGFNHGLIAAENVTLTWRRYWENCEFMFPLPASKEVDGMVTMELGRLAANSSIVIPIQINLLYEIPSGTVVTQTMNGYSYITPTRNDPIWLVSPYYMFMPYSDPVNGKVLVQLNADDGTVDFIYYYGNSTKITYIYNDTDLVDKITSENEVEPSARKLSTTSVSSSKHRRLTCFDFGGGLAAAAMAAIPWQASIPIAILQGAALGVAIWAILCGVPRADEFNWSALGGGDAGGGCDPGGGGGGGDEDAGGGSGVYSIGNNNCRPKRLQGIRRKMLELDCIGCSEENLKFVFDSFSNFESDLLRAESNLQVCADDAQSSDGIRSIFPCILKHVLNVLPMLPAASEVSDCELNTRPCQDDLSDKPGQLNLIIQSDRLRSFLGLALLSFGGTLSSNVILFNATTLPVTQTQVESFSVALVKGLSDTSEAGPAIAQSELDELLDIDLEIPNNDDIRAFADTWNRSLILWDSGVISSSDLPANYSNSFFDLTEASSFVSDFKRDRVSVKREGFNGFGDAWTKAVEGQQFEKARLLAGVCANVRVKIEQELTLTRIGFQAKLEIGNDGSTPLEEISVTLRINPFQNYTYDATSLFVIDEPDLNKITSVDGNGTLIANSDGAVTWLMMPLTEAAPVFDTKYEVSGILFYVISGVEYIQNLSPDTITVKPDPQLHLTYFHSRIAFSDDPFTEDIIEPAQPFHLGILIENKGYGKASNVKIASSQPEIIDNKKGLLVDFSIIGARFGNMPTANTFNIDFGDVEANSNKIGVWDLVSTLRGNFYNFSATFEYKGPINDDRLSLIESVDIFELTQLVRITDHPAMPNGGLGYIDDGLDDFLVNVNPDAYYIPDTVFTSDTRSHNFTVSSVVDRALSLTPQFDSERVTVLVNHNLTHQEKSRLHDWVYIRFDDPLANEPGYILQRATRLDVNYTLIENANSWQTSWTDYLIDGSIDQLDYIHLFDYGVAPVYELEYLLQQPVDNLHIKKSTVNSITVAWEKASGASSSYIIIKTEGFGNEYFKTAKSFTQVESVTIHNLMAATSYVIKVYTGSKGKYEQMGAQVIGSTIGNTTCGNGNIDAGEECDDGALDGTSDSNCTSACMIFKPPITNPSMYPSSFPSSIPTSIPSTSEPSDVPSRLPRVEPSSKPSIGPSSLPSSEPSDGSSRTPSLTPSSAPSSEPTLKPSSQPSSDPSSLPTSKPSLDPSSEPSRSPSDMPSLKPSVKPSFEPSRSPSVKPSFPPSLRHTFNPTLTSVSPSLHQSTQPSLFRSATPSNDLSSTSPSTAKCAGKNKPAVRCGAKYGEKSCCHGLVCHAHQFWRCVEDKNKECAGRNTFSKQCGSKYKRAAPKCCPGLSCSKNKKCFKPTTCAAENERSRYCGAGGGEDACCPGLVCHKYQSWRCVEEKNKECSGPNTFSKQCAPKYKEAAPECCPGLICNNGKCVSD